MMMTFLKWSDLGYLALGDGEIRGDGDDVASDFLIRR